eukprot:gene15524-20954_t
MEPNANWRSAFSDSPRTETRVNKPAKVSYMDDDFSFMDLDYDDFESAMKEMENGGMNPGGGVSKRTEIPQEHDGLNSGDIIDDKIWNELKEPQDGKVYSYDKLKNKELCDIVVLYADPRRMNDEFKIVLNQLIKVPKTTLKISLLAVNCDESNEQRKFLKKNVLPFPLLADTNKKLMDAIRCRAHKRITSALVIIDVSSRKILKIWYEKDWDSATTRDLILDEITNYRRNPQHYVQSQIGIR